MIARAIAYKGSPGEIRTPVGGSKALYPCPLARAILTLAITRIFKKRAFSVPHVEGKHGNLRARFVSYISS